MKNNFLGILIVISLLLVLNSNAFLTPDKTPIQQPAVEPKIQVAILLDVSNSMDGLIEQAKGQLWNMVNILGKAKCDGKEPEIEIALYEYGRSSNNPSNGFVKKISGFTKDLDPLSQKLFNLTTDGGEEYCGTVLHAALSDLNWDEAPGNYKVVFIAGNEDFYQGNISYLKACKAAQTKGVVVNTIYCGNRHQGIAEHWNLAGKCGNGSYSNIDQNAKLEEIPTPYDSKILALNNKLNQTYISFGKNGHEYKAAQSALDDKNEKMSSGVAVKRAEVKSKSKLYKNTGWDLVDAMEENKKMLETLDKETLPEHLKYKSDNELKVIIANKKSERTEVQKEIDKLAIERESYIDSERKKGTNANANTLQSEIEKAIRKQAKQFKMIIN